VVVLLLSPICLPDALVEVAQLQVGGGIELPAEGGGETVLVEQEIRFLETDVRKELVICGHENGAFHGDFDGPAVADALLKVPARWTANPALFEAKTLLELTKVEVLADHPLLPDAVLIGHPGNGLGTIGEAADPAVPAGEGGPGAGVVVQAQPGEGLLPGRTPILAPPLVLGVETPAVIEPVVALVDVPAVELGGCFALGMGGQRHQGGEWE